MAHTQKELKALVKRRHPEYDELLPHWEFLEHCYEGGREWFKQNIFRYIKEGEKEFSDRVQRCYRFNHTREVVDLVDKYLFKMECARNVTDAPKSVQEFWKSATLDGLSVKDYLKQISKMTSIFGRIWIVTDNTKTVQGATVADDKAEGARTYSYYVTPKNVTDLSYDENGKLRWIMIHEQIRDDEDPILSTGEVQDRYRLWGKESWTTFTVSKKQAGSAEPEDSASAYTLIAKMAEATRSGVTGYVGSFKKSDTYQIDVAGPYAHSFGEVPVFAADNTISHELYASQSMIDDVAYLDRAAANYLSNLDAIIQDQSFSQLTIPAQAMEPGEDGYDKLIEMGTKRIFTYDAEGGGRPEFISPDVKQAEIILKVINKIISEIYHTVGLAGERTKEDNALGIDNSSGVAKAYDFERVNSLLAAKADSLEVVENKLAQFVAKWNGEELKGDDLVAYPDNFDVRGLYDEFEIAARLALIEAPESMRRQQMKSVIDKLFPKLSKDLKEKMVADLKKWPPVLIDPMNPGDQSSTDTIKQAGNNSLANKLVKDAG